jgi:uncharacterized metal-binding protein
MPELPRKKVGIVSCSGEEQPEGTVTRLAALKVLEQLRPADTVTICLPLFLAGGEGDRAFAKFYPTIAVDGCDKRCAARGTEMYSGKPAASIVVTELVAEQGLGKPEGKRRLNEVGLQVVDAAAGQIAGLVAELLGLQWNRTAGAAEEIGLPVIQERVQKPFQETCSCGSGIPEQSVVVNGRKVTLIALPLVFQQYLDAGEPATQRIAREVFDIMKIYNPIPPGEDDAFIEVLSREYAFFREKVGAK